jgi:hypothetical protein
MNYSSNLTQLYSRALIPAVVQHPAWLGPMFEELSAQYVGAVLISVFDEPKNAEVLIAAAAIQRMGVSRGYIFPVAATWDCGFLFSGLPLLDKANPERSLLRLIKAATDKTKVRAVLLKKIPDEGPFSDAIKNLVGQGKLRAQYFDAHERAVLKPATNFDTWFTQNFSSKRRKEYRRLRKRLERQGVMKVHTWVDGESVQTWVEDFLSLEKAGWKGRRGTAIASTEEQARFFRAAMSGMAEAKKLMLWRISLDDKPIAMLFALGNVKDGQMSLGKMAYDEGFAQYSPGVMVILEATRSFLDKGLDVSVDSAADSDHPMIDNIWRDRLKISDVLLSLPEDSHALFGIMVQTEKIRRALRGLVKYIYNAIRRRK